MLSPRLIASITSIIVVSACARAEAARVSRLDTGAGSAPLAATTPEKITCQGAYGIPTVDAQPSLELAADLAAQTGSLTLDAGTPSARTLAISCGLAPATTDGRIVCATADHAQLVTIDGASASLWSNGVPQPSSIACTSSGSLPGSGAGQAFDRIAIGRYGALASPTAPSGVCAFTDELILDKTQVTGSYVVEVAAAPNEFCTPADVAAHPSRSFAVRSATLEACDLRIEAVGTDGKSLTITDGRAHLPPSSDPSQPSCPSWPGDLNVSTNVAGITNMWIQTTP